MKAKQIPSTGTSFQSRLPAIRPAGLAVAGISAVALFLLCGCATNKPAGITSNDGQPLPAPLRAELGSIALVSAVEPAQYSFDKAQGQIESAGHLAGVAAGNCLVPSTQDPGLAVLDSAVRIVAAPIAAIGASGKASQRLAPEQMSECNSNLARAMRGMADQKHFKDALLKAGARKTDRRFLTAPVQQGAVSDQNLPDTILETRTEQLRLERTGKADDTFALRIQARTRLLRVADGAVLFDRPAEYVSGTCLFLDWTLDNSLRKVAETGYRELAERAVDQLFVGAQDAPIMRGAGYKQPAARQRQPAATLVKSPASPLRPAAQLVGFADDASGAIEIYSADKLPRVALQRPLTKDEAASEAVKAMEYDFDGLYNHPNTVISLASIAVAVPVGIWRQAVAVATGLTEKGHRKADVQLTAAARQAEPQQAVACAVAQQLAPQTSRQVMLARGSFVPARERNVQLASGRDGNEPGVKTVRRAVSNEQKPGTALEIKVISAGLKGGTGANPALAFCIEAKARVLRAQDGSELCSYPIHYRSKPHKFTQWAADDAKLFRQELEQSYREVGTAIAEEMVAQGFAPPAIVSRPIVATN